MIIIKLQVKNNNTTFLPILLGTDANAYGMARSFYQEFGIKSLSLGKIPLLETRHSKLVHVETNPKFDQDETFLKTLDEVYELYKPHYDQLILIACGDRYTELLTLYRKQLEDRFIVPYIDNALKLKLENKEDFYAICEEYGLDFPATYIVTPETQNEIKLPFGFPVAVKASNSIEYVDLDFPGKKKAYKAESQEEMETIIHNIFQAGYQGSIIIQDFIPGDASAMYVLNAYSNKEGKVQAMCLGHCVLEDLTPAGIGNYNAIIQEGNDAIYDQYKSFLEKIGFVGFSNFDLKYDKRDGKYKVFEINIRQGRSSFFTTASGCNLTKYLVNDRIHNIELQTPHYHHNPFLWLHVPKELLLKYANEKTLPQIRRLINEKQCDCTLLYDQDRTLYRLIMINRFYHQAWKKYEENL